MGARARGGWIVALLAWSLPALAAPQGPSFDCRRATGPLERAICADADLATLDRSLADALKARLAALPAGRARDALAADQRRWMGARAGACPAALPPVPARITEAALAECLTRLYGQRIGALSREATEARWPNVPFRPALVEGAGVALCEAFHRDVLASFFGPADRVNPLGEREIGFRPILLARSSDEDAPRAAVAALDPFNRGAEGVVLRLESMPRTGEAAWTHRVFSSEETLRRAFRISPSGARNPYAIGGDGDTSRPLVDPAHFGKPGASLPELASEDRPVPLAPRLLREDGRVLAAIPSERDGTTLLGLYALEGPQSVRRLCLSQSGRGLAPDEGFASLPEVETLRQVANGILPPLACAPARDEERTFEARAALRPWSMREIPVRSGPSRALGTEELRLFLRRKAMTGIEARRTVEALRAALTEAEVRVALLYAERFGRDEAGARALARLYLERHLAAGLVVEEEGPIRPLLAPDFEARHVAHAAALAGDGPALWSRLGAASRATIAGLQGDGDEPLASLALEHPEVLRGLLARGADPDAFGASGLTPLMTAARLGLDEAARILLEAGADPNLVSRPARYEARILDAPACGRTAFEIAEGAGAGEIAALLDPRTALRSPR